MGVGQEGFATIGRPLDGAPHALTRPDQRGFLGIQINFRTKPAAYVRRDHAHLRFGQSQNKRAHQEALDVRILV